VLVAGAVLSPGRRTVAAALSSVGLRGAASFTNYHRVLNRSRWSGRAAARCLLGLLVAAFVPSGPVVVGIDETIERRWGAKIKGHRQLVGLRSRWGATRTVCPWLRRSGDVGDLGPDLKGLGPGGSILRGGHSVTAEVEEVVDPVMGGQETLRLPS